MRYRMVNVATAKNKAAAAFAAAMLVVPLVAANGDDYQYIVSGYPVANPSQSLASESIPLATGRYARRSVEAPLEARYRTWDESDGIALRSNKARGMTICIR